MIEHIPDDMTCTVAAEVTLAALQAELAKRGQWLPIDPSRPERLTIGALLANNESGPRRFGYGSIRDSLIGIKVALADGRVIKAGGQVVKNVAGFDLCKLFVGSRGTLGTIVEATFKLRPLPEAEKFVEINCDSLPRAATILERVLNSELTPVVLDLHNLTALQVVLGFAGTREEVDWQVAQTAELHGHVMSNLGYDAKFWADETAGALQRLSVLPSKITEAVGALGDVPFVARAGNGLIWYRGAAVAAVGDRGVGDNRAHRARLQLMQRVKDAYDPKHLLPEVTA